MTDPSRAVEPAASTARSVLFGRASETLFGWFHEPAAGHRDLAVLLCPPIGVELLRVYRAYRQLAVELADAGFPVLRFDYHGTGNSTGRDEDEGRIEAWLQSVRSAADELKQQSGALRLALFGLRLGASLAWQEAARREDVAALVLWAPVQKGRLYARELRALARVGQGYPGPPPGLMESGGFVFTDATMAELSRLDLLASPAPHAKSALVIARDDLPAEGPVVARLQTFGIETELCARPGYAALMRDPHDSVVPSEVFADVRRWLTQRSAPLHARQVAIQPAGQPTAVASPHFREQAEHFGPLRQLFGIACEPSRPAGDQPAVLLLNVGSNHHIGPNRMWVTLARDLAREGFFSLRFDVAGLGDSPPQPGGKPNRLYTQDSVQDVKTAMSHLVDSRGHRRFLLVGLCSGAYLAFYSTLEDARVAGQVLINPQTFHWKEGDSLELAMRRSYKSNRYYARTIFLPSTWRRIQRGEVNVKGVAQALARRLGVRASDVLRVFRRRRPEDGVDVARAFRMIAKRETDSLLVYSAEDGGLDEIERHLGSDARRMRHHANFAFRTIEGADHTFTPYVARDGLLRLVARHLTERFGASP